jgi:predicted nucleic acid-binding protein
MRKINSVYLDVCALCRPFDNQDFLRIRMETEAVNLILAKIKMGVCKMLVSPVHRREIDAIPDILERVELQTILDKYGDDVKVNVSEARSRAEKFVLQGFGVADAAHVAFAEASEAYFISCDDRLIKKCISSKVKVWCGTPLTYCAYMELK